MAVRLSKIEVDRAQATGSDYFLWDSVLKGFGLRVSKAGVKSYVAQYRTAGGRSGQTKRLTIGRHGSPWTADAARDEARKLLGAVAHGADPSSVRKALREMPTIAELCDDYLIEGVATKKQSTQDTDKGRIERHIKPLLGRRRVNEVTQDDIRKFMKAVAGGATATTVKTKRYGKAVVTGGKGTATRTVGLLGGIFTYAVQLGLIASNPVHGVKRYGDKKGERFLSASEVGKLGTAIRQASSAGTNPKALTIISLLLLTGARRGEIEKLQWSEVDFGSRKLTLEDSKTGRKDVPLGSAAIALLSSWKKDSHDQSRFVFPSGRGPGHFVGTPRVWHNLRSAAGLTGVRMHDLRHSFASFGAVSGTPLLILGAILGHSDQATTQRYAHIGNDPAADAADTISGLIARALNVD